MTLSSSLEDYLEAIYDIEVTGHTVRVTDISSKLNVEKSSVNYAVKKLCNLNLVIHEPYTDIKLTASGKKAAHLVKNRHTVLRRFLNEFLLLPIEVADADACKIEHILSNDSFTRITSFLEFLDSAQHTKRSQLINSFTEFIKKKEDGEIM